MKKIFAIVGLFALVVLLIWQQKPQETLQNLPTLPSFVLADVVTLEIKQQAGSLQADYDGQTWTLVGDKHKQLKEAVVGQLLLDLQTMKPQRVASTKAEYVHRFAVADSDVRVTLSDNKGAKLLDMIIGKPATDLRSTYIRLFGQDTVLTVNKILTWQVKRTPGAWLVEEEKAEK